MMDREVLLDGLRFIASVSDAKMCEYMLAAIAEIEGKEGKEDAEN